MRDLKVATIGLALAYAIGLCSSTAAAAPRDSADTNCISSSRQLGAKPVDRATVMQTMNSIQRCSEQDALTSDAPLRDIWAMVLLIGSCLASLAIAGMLFWEAGVARQIGVPLAVAIAIMTGLAATLRVEGVSDQTNGVQSRVERAKWRWTVRMARSNQSTSDPAAIEEALAATNEFVETIAIERHR